MKTGIESSQPNFRFEESLGNKQNQSKRRLFTNLNNEDEIGTLDITELEERLLRKSKPRSTGISLFNSNLESEANTLDGITEVEEKKSNNHLFDNFSNIKM
jgi:hypothetical protein